MRTLLQALLSGSQATSYMLGSAALVIAVATAATAMTPAELMTWAGEVFGGVFLALLAALVFAALYCWVRLLQRPGDPVWLEAGVQSANGITTLALTFTLLGITLGIGSLAGQELTPATVQGIVRDLTANFSLAFLTTVAGLPLSAVLRTLLTVTDAHQRSRSQARTGPLCRDS